MYFSRATAVGSPARIQRITGRPLNPVGIFGAGVCELGLERVGGLSDTLRHRPGTLLQISLQAVTQVPDPIVFETDLAKAPATVAPIARPTAPRTSGCLSSRSDKRRLRLRQRFLPRQGPTARSNMSRAPAMPSSKRSLIVSAAPDIASEAAVLALRTVSLMPCEASSCIWEARFRMEPKHRPSSRRPTLCAGTEIGDRRGRGRHRTRPRSSVCRCRSAARGAASDQGRGKRDFPGQPRIRLSTKLRLCAAHRTIPFTVSLSFSSWRIVSRGARLRASSRFMPIANSTPAITAATIAEVK